MRLANVRRGARTWRFPPHAGRGDVHDPDEPQCRLVAVGADEVTNLAMIWSDGSRALHALQRAMNAPCARAVHAPRVLCARGFCVGIGWRACNARCSIRFARPTQQVFYAVRHVRPREEHARVRARVIVNAV